MLFYYGQMFVFSKLCCPAGEPYYNDAGIVYALRVVDLIIRATKWQLLMIGLLLLVSGTYAQSAITELCPDTGIQQRTADFQPGGIILTSFDSVAIWVYDIDRNTRYPLPETRPCTSNCQLSPDASWFIFLDPNTYTFGKMRLDGTQRTPLVAEASDVRWWTSDTLLVWTTDQQAYLRSENDPNAEITPLSSSGVISFQPGGRFALRIDEIDGNFVRQLVDLQQSGSAIPLTADRPYFNAAAWSPDGQYLAYVGDGDFDDAAQIAGGELFVVSPFDGVPRQLTNFSNTYGAVRINGYAPNDLSWSPDSSKIAVWVTEINDGNVEDPPAEARLHVVDLISGRVTRYCHFSTGDHTPETPRIVWSPDATHLAFAGNIPGDEKGALLLALDVSSGQFVELSNGMFPVYGIPQLNAWGTVP